MGDQVDAHSWLRSELLGLQYSIIAIRSVSIYHTLLMCLLGITNRSPWAAGFVSSLFLGFPLHVLLWLLLLLLVL